MGEIVEERCLAEGTSSEECTLRASEAREIAAFMGPSYHLAIGGDSAADWLLSGQCTDCYLPAFHHRPLTSVQAGLALSRFDEDADNPTRFNWGFISSSDNFSKDCSFLFISSTIPFSSEVNFPLPTESAFLNKFKFSWCHAPKSRDIQFALL